MNLQRILAATDFSAGANAALDRAAQLATATGAELLLLHALQHGGWMENVASGDTGLLRQPTIENIAAHALAAERERMASRVPAVACELLTGPLHRELDGLLAQRPAQLLVMGAHGAGGWQDMLLGSTVDRVLRLHRIPLLLVRTRPDIPYARIAVATDFSAPSEIAARFALSTFADAAHMMLHAQEPEFYHSLAFAGEAEEVRHAYQAEEVRHAYAQLEDFTRRVGSERAVPALRTGAPSRVLPQFVDEASIDLMVLGVSGRSAIERGLLGSVGRHAASGLPCDVLLVPTSPD